MSLPVLFSEFIRIALNPIKLGHGLVDTNRMKLIVIALALVSFSANAQETLRAAAGTDVAMQFAHYNDEGKSEELFLYCPPKATETECGVAKVVDGVQAATGKVKRAEAKKIAERFIDDLPAKDVVKGKEPPSLEKNPQTAFLWQAKSGPRWSKGSVSQEDSRNPAGDDGNQRRRLLALHALQTRLSSHLSEFAN